MFFNDKLKDKSDEIFTQWKATNEQFLHVVAKTIEKLSKEDNSHRRNIDDCDYAVDLFINETTDYGMRLLQFDQNLDAYEAFVKLLCNPALSQNPKVRFIARFYLGVILDEIVVVEGAL